MTDNTADTFRAYLKNVAEQCPSVAKVAGNDQKTKALVAALRQFTWLRIIKKIDPARLFTPSCQSISENTWRNYQVALQRVYTPDEITAARTADLAFIDAELERNPPPPEPDGPEEPSPKRRSGGSGGRGMRGA